MTFEIAHLHALANGLLTKLAADLTSAPARQFISIGPPVHDCAQLVVWVRQVEGTPFENQCAIVPKATFDVALIKCVAVVDSSGQLPSITTLQTESEQHLRDGWQLFNVLAQNRFDGDLFNSTPYDCGEVKLGPLVPFEPKGGLAGWRCSVSINPVH